MELHSEKIAKIIPRWDEGGEDKFGKAMTSGSYIYVFKPLNNALPLKSSSSMSGLVTFSMRVGASPKL